MNRTVKLFLLLKIDITELQKLDGMSIDKVFNTITKDAYEILTCTTSKKEALEYLFKVVKESRNEHYSMWRELKNLPDTENTLHIYINSCVDLSKYYIEKVKLNRTTLASFARLALNCKYRNCTFEVESYDKMNDMLSKYDMKIMK